MNWTTHPTPANCFCASIAWIAQESWRTHFQPEKHVFYIGERHGWGGRVKGCWVRCHVFESWPCHFLAEEQITDEQPGCRWRGGHSCWMWSPCWGDSATQARLWWSYNPVCSQYVGRLPWLKLAETLPWVDFQHPSKPVTPAVCTPAPFALTN